MRAGMTMKDPNPINRIFTNLWMVIKVILVLIYGVGFYVEKVLGLVAVPLWRFITGGWFRGVCAVGEWVIASGCKLGRGTVRLGTLIAHSFVHDFSWWAPCIGLVCFAAVLVRSHILVFICFLLPK